VLLAEADEAIARSALQMAWENLKKTRPQAKPQGNDL
jgi:hypothetical protein